MAFVVRHRNKVLKRIVIDFRDKPSIKGSAYEWAIFIDHPQYEKFKEMILTQWYPPQNYVQKTKLSAVVFNTPAVFECHGWKLGEYLSMGKAIISTPIINELPVKLEHGKNVHIVTNADEMKSALNFLLSNDKYRRSLENGAREYYEQFVSPKSVIGNILQGIV